MRTALIAVLLCAPLALASAQSPWGFQIQLDDEIRKIGEIRALETRNPTVAAAKYEEALRQFPAFPEPPSYYQDKLKADLERLKNEPRFILKPESLGAFLFNYHRRQELPLRAHLGLARCRAALGDHAVAERHAQAVIELIITKAVSTAFHDELFLSAYDFLEKHYRERGAMGKALLARLNRDLIADHFDSELGSADFLMIKQTYWDDQDAIWDVYMYVFKVYERRAEIKEQRWNRIMAGLSAVSGSLNTMAANQAAARGDSGAAMNYRFNASLATFILGGTQAKMVGQKVGLGSFLSTVAIPTVSAQLGDPRLGANADKILRVFASDAGKADPALAGAAGEISKGVNGIVTLREKGDKKKTQNAIGQFAEILTQFQAKVQEIGTTP